MTPSAVALTILATLALLVVVAGITRVFTKEEVVVYLALLVMGALVGILGANA